MNATGADSEATDAERPSPVLLEFLVGCGVVLAIAALVAYGALTARAPRLAASDTRVVASGNAIVVPAGGEVCQGGEHIPRTASRVRVFVASGGDGPPLEIALAGRYAVPVAAGYPDGPLDVALPDRTVDLLSGEVCIENLGTKDVQFAGNLISSNPDAVIGANGYGKPAGDAVRLDFYRPGRESLIDIVDEVARRFSLFKPRFVGGSGLWWVLAGLVVAAAAGSVLTARVLLAPEKAARRWTAVAALVAALAFVNAALWAVVTPPFQVPDEFVHVEYVEYLARSGNLPRAEALDPAAQRDFRDGVTNDEQEEVFEALPFSAEGRPSWSSADERRLQETVEAGVLQPTHVYGARNAASNPPLYYALLAPTARFGFRFGPIDRLFLLRLTSALLASVTAFLTFAFLRELLPQDPIASVVGSLAVAFHPVAAFMFGGVNNDDLLFAVGAALLFLVARAFGRGLTPVTGLLIGVVLGIGMVAKTRAVLLAPGVFFALGLVALKTWRERRRQDAVVSVVAALAAFALVEGSWLVAADVVFHRSTAEADVVRTADRHATSLRGTASYVWQYFLPRLPFMRDEFPGWPVYGLWDVYITGFVGKFGWFQYGFPERVVRAGGALLAALVTGAARALVLARGTLGRRVPELLAYAVMPVSLAVLLGVAGYRYRADTGYTLEQTRYLLPYLALYGGVVALAVRGSGRFRSFAAGVIVTLLAMHLIAAVLVSVARYYT